MAYDSLILNLDLELYALIDYEKKYKDALIRLLEEVYAEYNQVLELETLDSDLFKIKTKYKNPSVFRILVDKSNDKLIGSVAVKIKNNNAELKRVFLQKNYRGQGLGKYMSLWGFNYAKEKGFKYIDIWSDVLFINAHVLYKKLGAEDMNKKRFIGGINNISEYYFRKSFG